jgi:hypothetical protein
MPVPRWTTRIPRSRGAVAGGIAGLVVLGAAGAAYAAGSTTTTSPTTGSGATTTTPATAPPTAPDSRPGRHFGGGGMGFGGMGFGGDVVHGTYTVGDGNGGYKTVEVQIGKASAVSSTSITVTSADGYVHTYVVSASTVVDAQRDGIASVASGDTVDLQATTSAGKDTATNVIDTTKIGSSRTGFGFGHGPMEAPAGPAPAA